MIAAALAAASAFAGVPGATVTTYPVEGTDAASIRASLDAVGPIDHNDGSHVEAITHWRFTWRWPGPPKRCRLAAAKVRFTATVTLPRLVDEDAVSPAILADWQRYRAALEAHEANHVRYAYRHRREVLAAIRGATCATADAAATAVVRRLVDHDLAYDRDTRHGASEGAMFP